MPCIGNVPVGTIWDYHCVPPPPPPKPCVGYKPTGKDCVYLNSSGVCPGEYWGPSGARYDEDGNFLRYETTCFDSGGWTTFRYPGEKRGQKYGPGDSYLPFCGVNNGCGTPKPIPEVVSCLEYSKRGGGIFATVSGGEPDSGPWKCQADAYSGIFVGCDSTGPVEVQGGNRMPGKWHPCADFGYFYNNKNFNVFEVQMVNVAQSISDGPRAKRNSNPADGYQTLILDIPPLREGGVALLEGLGWQVLASGVYAGLVVGATASIVSGLKNARALAKQFLDSFPVLEAPPVLS